MTTPNLPFDGRSLRRFLTVQALFALDSSANYAETAQHLSQSEDLLGFHPEDLISAEKVSDVSEALPKVTTVDRSKALELALELWACREKVDNLIIPALRGWRLERLDGVDRAILRLCVYEARVGATVNDAVAASEAVELAKAMSGDESARFLNGVIGSVLRGDG